MDRAAALALLFCFSFGCASTMQSKSTGWLEVRTEDLRLRTNLRKRQAVAFAEEAQRLGNAIIQNEFPCASAHLADAVDVTVVRDSEEFRGFHSAPPTRLLDMQPRVVVYGDDLTGVTRVFVHELSHRLLAVCIPNAPPWLNEGVASYYETALLDGDELRLGFPPYMFVDEVDGAEVVGVAAALYKGEPITLLPRGLAPGFEELRTMTRSTFYAEQGCAARTAYYAGAWAVVHMLEFTDLDLQGRFGRYLRLMRDGADPERAWESTLADLGVAGLYAQYLTLGQSDWAHRKVEVPPVAPPTVRDLSPAEAAIVRAELEDWREPEGLLAAGEWLAFANAQNPDSIETWLYLGALCEAQGESTCAREHFERALDREPANPDALAASLMWFGFHEELWRDARPEIVERVEALAAHAESAFHLATAAWWYSNLQDCKSALELAKKAIAVNRTNWLARAVAGACFARAGDLPSALREYRAALALSHHGGGELARELQGEIAQIELLMRHRSRDD